MTRSLSNRCSRGGVRMLASGVLAALLAAGGAGCLWAIDGAAERGASLPGLNVGYFLGGRTSIIMRIQEHGGFAAEGISVALLTKSLRGKEYRPLTRARVEKRLDESLVTGPELIAGLFADSWDLATVGESSFLAAVSARQPVIAIAKLGYDLSGKSGHLFAVRKGERLQAPADYRGKIFVSRRAGPGDAAFLLEFLAQAGIDLERDVLVLTRLPASLSEKRRLPQNKVLLVHQVFEDDLTRGVRSGLIDGGFFHLKPFEKLSDVLVMVKPLHEWAQADNSMVLLVCTRASIKDSDGRDRAKAFLRAVIKRVRLEKSMTPGERRAQSSRNGSVQRWRGLVSSTPNVDYPQYDEAPVVSSAPLHDMAMLLRRHKLVDWPMADLEAHIDNSLVEEIVKEPGWAGRRSR